MSFKRASFFGEAIGMTSFGRQTMPDVVCDLSLHNRSRDGIESAPVEASPLEEALEGLTGLLWSY